MVARAPGSAHARRRLRVLSVWLLLATGVTFLMLACRERHRGSGARSEPVAQHQAALGPPAGGGTGGAPEASGEVLGAAPLCEPSAALRAPWDANQILVADNEVHDTLFELELRGGRLEVVGSAAMPARRRPRDIEALAALSGERILVVGSHSRNKRCEARPKRQRLRVLQRAPDGALEEVSFVDSAPLWASLGSNSRCVETWFAPQTAGAEAVCASLVEAEAGTGCGALNIEGAFGDAGDPAGAHVWLGLRAPLLDDGPAIVLRLAQASLTGDAQLLADGMLRLELDGQGVRELALDDQGVVWISAGASHDALTAHSLWRVPLETWRVSLGKTLRPERVVSLPTSTEGLVFDGADAVIGLVDGVEGEPACERAARQVRVALP